MPYLDTMMHVIILNALTFLVAEDGIYCVSLFHGVFQTYTHTYIYMCTYMYINVCVFTSFDITCKISCF